LTQELPRNRLNRKEKLKIKLKRVSNKKKNAETFVSLQVPAVDPRRLCYLQTAIGQNQRSATMKEKEIVVEATSSSN
jgi:hypothetical protein